MSGGNSGSLDCKVYVGNLGNEGSRSELERVFGYYGTLRNVWVARNPPGFAFVQFEDPRDAEDAVHALDGRTICGARARVEMSSGMSRRGGGGGGRDRDRAYGRYDDYDNYNNRRVGRYDRSHSRSPRRRYSKSRSRSPRREKRRSLSRSPSYKRKSSPSPRRSMSPVDRSNSASPSPSPRSLKDDRSRSHS